MSSSQNFGFEGDQISTKVPQFHKPRRISLPYSLTSKIKQTLLPEVDLFPSYIEKYADFVPFSGALEGMAPLPPSGSAYWCGEFPNVMRKSPLSQGKIRRIWPTIFKKGPHF